ncbi:hypothetical protein FACS1894172_09790 [Spirochaetia bacterium]|nr:hypothetical protein FACS1894164_08270 [Spirochaetia bacterium]GHU32703.1 hypothetical protein FACS1894172_09790 [Spirochaetia bacterium]
MTEGIEPRTLADINAILDKLLLSYTEEREAREAMEALFLRRADRLDQRVGKLGNRLGEIVETLFIPNIVERFKALNHSIRKASPNVEVLDEQGNTLTELDIVLENGEDVIVVEVKTNLSEQHIYDHVKRMNLLASRAFYPGKKLYGAIAGAIIEQKTKTDALEQGFYVIEYTGDAVHIETLDGTFEPKQWQ